MSKGNCLDFMNNTNEWYMCNNRKYKSCDPFIRKDLDYLTIYEVTHMEYEDMNQYLESYENLFDSLQLEDIIVIFIIYSNGQTVKFYYGITEDMHKGLPKERREEVVKEAMSIFESSFYGFFQEGKITKLTEEDEKKILEQLWSFQTGAIIEGAPGKLGTNIKLPSTSNVEKVMKGDPFMVVRLARPLSRDEIQKSEEEIIKLNQEIAALITTTVSKSTTQNCSRTLGLSAQNQSSKTRSCNESDTRKEQKFMGDEELDEEILDLPALDGDFVVNDRERQRTIGKGRTCLNSCHRNLSNTMLNSCSITRTKTNIYIDQQAKGWNDYINNVVYPRIDNGKARGLYVFTTAIFTNCKGALVKLDCALRNGCKQGEGDKIPTRRQQLSINDPQICCIKNFHFPVYKKCGQGKSYSVEEFDNRYGFSQLSNGGITWGGNLASSKELGVLFSVPKIFGI